MIKKKKLNLSKQQCLNVLEDLKDVIYFAMKHRVHHVTMHRIMKNAVVINKFRINNKKIGELKRPQYEKLKECLFLIPHNVKLPLILYGKGFETF